MATIFNVTELGFVAQGQTILEHVSFTVEQGDYLTIVGPSGSGKSTLLRLLATLLTPTSGSIDYIGQPQASYAKPAYRQEVSYCFQQPSLFGDTVQDNLAFPYQLRHQPFDQEAAEAGLARVDLPASMLKKPIIDLSGGEKQRVALLRNLLFPPKVLLLDEVTTGLDADTKQIIHQLIADYNQTTGITVLAVTHDEGEIEAAHTLLRVFNHTLEVPHG